MINTTELLSKKKREYKDSLFRMLFSDKTELLHLYNAIHGTNYTNPDDLEVTTLQNAIYMSIKNDLSFIIHEELSLYEHQSTWSGNLPLRNLFYIGNVYAKLTTDKNLYGSKVISIPNPHFVVFYNGMKEIPERSYQYLSSAYTHLENPKLELEILVLNINKGYNEQLMKNCKTLAEYVEYVDTVRKYNKEMPLEEAVDKAIKECIKKDVLADFLRNHRNEVEHMSIFEYDQERHLQMERADAREEGRASGTILTLRKLKYTDGEIVKFLIAELNVSEQKAKEYVG